MNQVAALPLRFRDGRLEVCLITTRRTGRWSIPKGWPMKGKRKREAAAIEAREEAGLVGKTTKIPIGKFNYWKIRFPMIAYLKVEVYRLDVKRTLKAWPEKDQRRVLWVPPDEAAEMVS